MILYQKTKPNPMPLGGSTRNLSLRSQANFANSKLSAKHQSLTEAHDFLFGFYKTQLEPSQPQDLLLIIG